MDPSIRSRGQQAAPAAEDKLEGQKRSRTEELVQSRRIAMSCSWLASSGVGVVTTHAHAWSRLSAYRTRIILQQTHAIVLGSGEQTAWTMRASRACEVTRRLGIVQRCFVDRFRWQCGRVSDKAAGPPIDWRPMSGHAHGCSFVGAGSTWARECAIIAACRNQHLTSQSSPPSSLHFSHLDITTTILPSLSPPSNYCSLLPQRIAGIRSPTTVPSHLSLRPFGSV